MTELPISSNMKEQYKREGYRGIIMTRQEQAAHTQNRIYEEALHLINQNGFDNVSVDRITQAAEIAKGTFYYYFKTKGELISYTYQYINNFYMEALEIAKKEQTFEKMLRTFVWESYQRIQTVGQEMMRALCITLAKSENKETFLDEKRGLYTSLRYIFEFGLKNNAFSDAYEVNYYVRKVVIILLGVDNYWIQLDARESLPELAVNCLDVLLQGFVRENA